MEKELLPFNEYCVEYIKEHVHDFLNTEHYCCDFCMTITDGANCDGTLTYSRSEAIDYLCEWWGDAAEYWNYEKDNFGENLHNPFDNPEAYMVCMVIEGCSAILSRVPFIEENWSEKVVIDDERIKEIIDFVNDFDTSEDLF